MLNYIYIHMNKYMYIRGEFNKFPVLVQAFKIVIYS